MQRQLSAECSDFRKLLKSLQIHTFCRQDWHWHLFRLNKYYDLISQIIWTQSSSSMLLKYISLLIQFETRVGDMYISVIFAAVHTCNSDPSSSFNIIKSAWRGYLTMTVRAFSWCQTALVRYYWNYKFSLILDFFSINGFRIINWTKIVFTNQTARIISLGQLWRRKWTNSHWPGDLQWEWVASR